MPKKNAAAAAEPSVAPAVKAKPAAKATGTVAAPKTRAKAAIAEPVGAPQAVSTSTTKATTVKKKAAEPGEAAVSTENAPKTAKPATAAPPETAVATITKAKAAELDGKIDAQIKGLGDQLAKAYLAVGAFLKEMRDTGGYAHLGHETWEAYLDSKKEYGRTYLSYLYKLGQATGLDAFVGQGMSGTKLIEFAKRTDYPGMIPRLIEATWEEVKDSPVRETAVRLGKFVAEHPEFRRERGKGKGGGRPRLTLRDRLEREWAALGTDGDRDEYVATLRAFAREKRPRRKDEV